MASQWCGARLRSVELAAIKKIIGGCLSNVEVVFNRQSVNQQKLKMVLLKQIEFIIIGTYHISSVNNGDVLDYTEFSFPVNLGVNRSVRPFRAKNDDIDSIR